jgi:hypothetical protein
MMRPSKWRPKDIVVFDWLRSGYDLRITSPRRLRLYLMNFSVRFYVLSAPHSLSRYMNSNDVHIRRPVVWCIFILWIIYTASGIGGAQNIPFFVWSGPQSPVLFVMFTEHSGGRQVTDFVFVAVGGEWDRMYKVFCLRRARAMGTVCVVFDCLFCSDWDCGRECWCTASVGHMFADPHSFACPSDWKCF